jgi:hypothetical protein
MLAGASIPRSEKSLLPLENSDALDTFEFLYVSRGGQATLTDKSYLSGPPELVSELAAR